ncbi:MAG: MGMT family protein [Verrucomicrobiaceae bacterium]|nr:MGMT family protein [Verrucomicrobiaceae bacterium]
MTDREPTAFEQKVYDFTLSIPRGRVSTYGAIARAIGCRSSQAIGQALRRNPYAPEVPCHRVVSTGLNIGGFSGERAGAEIDRKRKLLIDEGVRFLDESQIAPECLWEG